MSGPDLTAVSAAFGRAAHVILDEPPYIPVPPGNGWWLLVPIWESDQMANPLRRFAPPEPR
jgi:hypothetical protein